MASTSGRMKKKEDDWDCGVCGINYNEDVQMKTSAQWVQCSFCVVWYHSQCQTSYEEGEDVFMCDGCQTDTDEED